MKTMFRKFALASLATTPLLSFAAAPDFTTLTSGIDFGTIVAAIMAVALLFVGVILAVKGAKIVMNFLQQGRA
jgi:hypothetical protein